MQVQKVGSLAWARARVVKIGATSRLLWEVWRKNPPASRKLPPVAAHLPAAMRTRFYRLNPQGYHNMVRDIADRLLLDNQEDEAAILRSLKGKLSDLELELVAVRLDQIAQRSRHIATQLCAVSRDLSKSTDP